MNRIKILIFIGAISFSLNAQTSDISSLLGVWENEGYGRVVEIKKNKTYIYDINNLNCTQAQVVRNKVFFNEYKVLKTSETTLEVGVLSKYHFKKIDRLPALCKANNKKVKDPLYNFDVLWQTFNEHYVYFKERNIDWNALRTKYRSKITKNTTPIQLYIVLDDMINEIDDGHSNIFIPRKLRKKYAKHREAKREIRRRKLLDSLGQDYKLMPIHVDSTRLNVISDYVDKVKTYNFGLLNYGLINKDVGLVQINGMAEFANYNIPTDLSEDKAERMYEKQANKSKNYTQDNVDGVAYIMDKVITEIKDTKACILDLRFNGGGFDEVQLEILKRFAAKDTLAVTKKAKNGNEFTRDVHFYVTPTSNSYKGKLIILTSYQTASAAEDFLLAAMAARPDAIRVGSDTEGIFSDMLEKKLPNGWDYTLSNEIYLGANGKSYEVTGVPPHHKIVYDKRGYWFYRSFVENKTGKDAAIEKALELIKTQ